MKRLVVLASLAVIAAACAPTPRPAPLPYTPPPSSSQVVRPAAPLPQASNRPIVPPHVASAGPLKTAAVSAYMDTQEHDLRHGLHPYGVVIARRGDGMMLNIPNGALFDGNQLSLRGASLLATLSVILRRYDHSAVTVSGYTDTTGSPEQNLTVSQRRAQLITATLAKNGVASGRLSAQGYGENGLKVRTGDSVSEQRNRRIEIRISPTPAG